MKQSSKKKLMMTIVRRDVCKSVILFGSNMISQRTAMEFGMPPIQNSE